MTFRPMASIPDNRSKLSTAMTKRLITLKRLSALPRPRMPNTKEERVGTSNTKKRVRLFLRSSGKYDKMISALSVGERAGVAIYKAIQRTKMKEGMVNTMSPAIESELRQLVLLFIAK